MNTTETYPNPSDGLFNIKLSQHPENYKQINIYDIYGNKVFHKDNIYEHVITIDFSDKHGIYIIEFILLDKIEFSRIIVK
ncbi:MAG: T9SS type A sorting domain-containing protein [Bacteroidales bacterium]|nr:T9SS type A sorting domain-containing protein [Bacteroidales bacterium]